jgi:predicted amidohydrolase
VTEPALAARRAGTVRVAAAQFYSGDDVGANLAMIVGYMRQAAARRCALIVMPENSNRVRDYSGPEDAYGKAEAIDGPFVDGLRAAARELGIMVSIGVDLRASSPPDVHIGVLLIDSTGEILHVHHKTVLWDYEYTLFTPGTKQLEVVDTPIGTVGLYSCADGIVPEVPRVLALKGAQMLLNSLNSRGPDEMRVHEPVRATENHVWCVAANTVGGPKDGYPWTGGSQIISPTGEILANAGETEAGWVWADITPDTSYPKAVGQLGLLDAYRRPDLYAELLAAVDSHAAAAMHGPVAESTPSRWLTVAALQTSWYHATSWTLQRARTQIEYAAKRGASLAVLPELFIHRPGEVAADPAAAAELSANALGVVTGAAAAHRVFVVVNLVECEGGRYYSTAYLVDDAGQIAARYRKVHLNTSERTWATAGDEFVVALSPIGRIGLMIGDEAWLPELARILALRGAEVIAHPVSWDRAEAATQAATERTEENHVHLISCARLDNPACLGSQIVVADRFIPGQPIAVMRYPTAITCRSQFEEDIFHTLDLVDAHSKTKGYHLDPIATRQPALYEALLGPFRNPESAADPVPASTAAGQSRAS